MPQASRNSSTSRGIGAAPVSASSSRPPNSSRTFDSTSRSASAYCALRTADALPARIAGRALRPVAIAQENRRCLTALPSLAAHQHARVDLLEHARDRREVGRLGGADVLHQPARVAAPERQRAADLDRHHLDHPRESVRERQEHEEGGGRLEAGLLDVRVAGEQHVAVGEHAALGRAGGARRVDDRGDVVGTDGVEAPLQLGLLDLAGTARAGRRPWWCRRPAPCSRRARGPAARRARPRSSRAAPRPRR